MPFDFNMYSSLLLPPVIQGLVVSVVLSVRGLRQGRQADLWLALLLLLLTLRPTNWMLGFAGWYDSHDAFTTFMFYFPWNWFLVLGPVLFFYFRSLTNPEYRWQPQDWWHLLPAMVVKGYQLILWIKEIVIESYFLGRPLVGHYGTRGPLDIPGLSTVVNVFDWVTPLWVFAYLGATLWQYQRYRRYVRGHFSDTDPVDFGWLRNFLLAFLLSQVIHWGFYLADSLSGDSLSYVEKWYDFFAWGLIIYYLSIAGLLANAKEQWLLDFEPSSLMSAESETLLQETPTPIDPLQQQRLAAYMQQERPYLSPGLTLKELAAQLTMPQAELSRLINQAYGQHFNDFINQYRVKAVQNAILAPEHAHLSLLGIALECGFNSKATFNRVFKQHVGLSPSAWRNKEKG